MKLDLDKNMAWTLFVSAVVITICVLAATVIMMLNLFHYGELTVGYFLAGSSVMAVCIWIAATLDKVEKRLEKRACHTKNIDQITRYKL